MDVKSLNKEIEKLDKKISDLTSQRGTLQRARSALIDSQRCDFMKNSNTRCLKDANHEGMHREPCINRVAHPAHHDIFRYDIEGASYEVICSGYAFDRT